MGLNPGAEIPPPRWAASNCDWSMMLPMEFSHDGGEKNSKSLVLINNCASVPPSRFRAESMSNLLALRNWANSLKVKKRLEVLKTRILPTRSVAITVRLDLFVAVPHPDVALVVQQQWKGLHPLGPGQVLGIDGGGLEVQDGGPGQVRGDALGLRHKHAAHLPVVGRADGLAVSHDQTHRLIVGSIIAGVEDDGGLQFLLPVGDALGGMVKDPEGIGGRIDLHHRQGAHDLVDLSLPEHLHLSETEAPAQRLPLGRGVAQAGGPAR